MPEVKLVFLESVGAWPSIPSVQTYIRFAIMILLTITQSPVPPPEALPMIGKFEGESHRVSAWSSLQGLTFTAQSDGCVLNGGGSQITLSTAKGSLKIDGSSMLGLPLYYTVDRRGDFYCSTHIKLLREVGVEIAENRDALPEFFIYRCVMPPTTLYKGIRRILHAGSVELALDGNRWSLSRESPPEWIQDEGDGLRGSFDDHLVELTSLVSGAIRSIPDDEHDIASLMSGGIDSSITSQLCSKEKDANSTFSTSYPFESEQLEMERPYAESAAKAMGFHHKHYVPTVAEYRASILESIAFAEEPVHHLQTACLNVMFGKGIPHDKSTLVQGLGAGGAFGNFRNHLYMLDKPLYQALRTPMGYPLVKLVSSLTGRGHSLLGNLNNLRDKSSHEDYRNPLWKWHQYGDVDWVCQHFDVSPKAIIASQKLTMQKVEARSLYHAWASYSLLGDEDITLTLWSKIAHGNSRHLYSPFYEADVLRYAFAMPWKQKLQKPENCVRKSIAERVGVPDFVIQRRKTGFGIKRNDWAVEGSIFDPLVSLAAKVIDAEEIRQMRTREPSQAMIFWNMLNYALWKRLCIDGESLSALQDELAEAEARC
jgi:asparagine synthase (glutamine-hydrolysing)